MAEKLERFLGLISGTSMDAIEVALLELESHAAERGRVTAHSSYPWPDAVRSQKSRLAHSPQQLTLPECAELDQRMGHCFADAVDDFLAGAGIAPTSIRAIGSHGQTIMHAPDASHPYSVQLAAPAVIAMRCGIDVVADFRSIDLALGGQGAPLAPFFHQFWLRTDDESRAVLNLGGIANLSFLPAGTGLPLRGYDTGPANCLMDAWSEQHLGKAYDEGGAWAASAEPDPSLFQRLLADPYFARSGPRSTGRDYFSPDWLQRHLDDLAVEPASVQRTLLELTVRSIIDAIHNDALAAPERLVVCGGGARNGFLMQRLAADLPCQVSSFADFGIAPEAVEAATFAWLAHQRVSGALLGLPAVTGAARGASLGAIWLGRKG